MLDHSTGLLPLASGGMHPPKNKPSQGSFSSRRRGGCRILRTPPTPRKNDRVPHSSVSRAMPVVPFGDEPQISGRCHLATHKRAL